jgi:predicted RND superfamily exporter protein
MLQSENYLPSLSSVCADIYTDNVIGLDIIDEMLRDPFISGLLVNTEANVTAIYLELDDNVNSYIVRSQVIGDMMDVLSEYQNSYEFRIAGIPYFRNQYVNLLNAEIVMYISISSVLIIGLLWGLFGNLRGILIPIGIVWLTILLTVAVVVITGGYFEILSSTIAPILLCVGIADSVHLLSKYQDSRFSGMATGPALRETIMILGTATLMTSITTAIGFATLATSNVIPMKRFGIYTAAGVMIAFVITIFLLPTLLPYFKDPAGQKGPHNFVHDWLGEKLAKIYSFVIVYYRPIVLSTLLLTIIFGVAATGIRVNGKIFDDVGPDQQVMKDSRFFSERISPQFPLEFIIDTGVSEGAFDPVLIQKLDEFENYLISIPEIERTTSLATLLKQVHQLMSPNENDDSGLPGSRELIAQYMVLVELSDADGVDRLVDFDYSTIRVATNIQDAGSYRVNQIREQIEPWIQEHFSDQQVIITGTSILVADLTQNIVRSLGWSIALAFRFISLLMGVLFKDIRLVLISILPNVIPLIIAAGTMGFLGIDLKPSTAVIFTIAFGIAVDDSIHYLARLRIEITRTASLTEALSITTQRTGRAIVLTSVILIAGFGTLATSAFTSTMLMGALTSLTIITAFLADVFFLPALLYWVNPDFRSIRKLS